MNYQLLDLDLEWAMLQSLKGNFVGKVESKESTVIGTKTNWELECSNLKKRLSKATDSHLAQQLQILSLEGKVTELEAANKYLESEVKRLLKYI